MNNEMKAENEVEQKVENSIDWAIEDLNKELEKTYLRDSYKKVIKDAIKALKAVKNY